MTMLGKITKFFQKSSGPTDRLALAAFGKHPGWDDHIDDLGLDTPRLVKVKSNLYTQGISGNIDSAGWDQLTEPERLQGFAHEFLWRWSGDAVVGLIWSSRDGKGRSKYPMILCLQGSGLPISWLCSAGLERLRALKAKCQSLGSAIEVRAALDQAREELQSASVALPAGDDLPETHLIRRALRGFAGNDDGVIRILYDMERRLSGMRGSGPKGNSRVIDVSAHHFRVPRIAEATAVLETGRAWSAAIMDLIGAGSVLAAGVLAIEAVESSHVDLIVGDPSPASLFALRASTAREPFTSDIPFTIDAGFQASAMERIARWSQRTG
jgi:hypothetical protein